MDYSLEKLFECYDEGRYIVIDTETKLIDKDKSVYAYPPEFVLGVCWVENGVSGDPMQEHSVRYSKEYFKEIVEPAATPFICVGHNVCFDLLVTGIYKLSKMGHDIVWDTAIAEYEMFGQAFTYPSLQQLADKYCPGEMKENSVSEMIKAGVCPSTIPNDKLVEYCEQDVNITKKVFVAQMELFKEYPKNLQNLILQRMKYRMITHEMSCNGMMMDKDMMLDASRKLEIEEAILEARLIVDMKVLMPNADEVNPSSNQQLMGVLYGKGTYKVTKMVDTGEVYKSGDKKGQPKLKKEVVHLPYKNPLSTRIPKESVDEETLNQLIKFGVSTACEDFVETLLKYRTVSKERRTYFQGYYDVARDGEPYISLHTEFKHVATPTGRISSSKPNIQNLKSD